VSGASGSRVIVMRHAKSDYPWGVSDHDRPLNERGRRDAPAAGRWLDEHVAWPEDAAPLILVSTARRAQSTWALAAGELSARWEAATVEDEPRIYEAGPRMLHELLEEAAERSDTVILVGHNPGMASVIDALALAEPATWEATSKFPTSAIAVLSAGARLADALRRDHAFRVSAFAVPRG
jgi:phosphohistidine phosphatase